MSQSGLRKNLRFFLVFSGSNSTSKDKVRNDQELNRDDIHELPQLSFSCISESTDNFSFTNKLGEGGFGPVYKVDISHFYCTFDYKFIGLMHLNFILFYLPS